jgi:hypothetical protein
MPVYILDMLDLSAEIKSAFEKGEFSIRQTSAVSMVFGAIWTLKKHHIRFEELRWYRRNNESEICPC